MLLKRNELQKAITLRKQGKSYSEILKVVPVSQSTLSLWLRDIPLTKEQSRGLYYRRRVGQEKGALTRRKQREESQQKIFAKSITDISQISKRELWLLGIIAYWCEGTKQKENNVSQPVVFVNSDPFLLRLFVKWLRESCLIEEGNITYTLYIHKSADVAKSLDYWSKILGISENRFGKTFIKKHNITTVRKNTGISYHGLVRIMVRRSTDLNRKITGWIMGIDKIVNFT